MSAPRLDPYKAPYLAVVREHPPESTGAAAIAAYHRMPVPRTDPERRTAAALLGLNPDLVAAKPTACAAASEILDDPRCDLALAPGQLAFLERVERGAEPLSARVLERVLRMAGWVGGADQCLGLVEREPAPRGFVARNAARAREYAP